MEKSNNDLFELMTKMYSEMANRMDSIDGRMNSIESKINTMDKKLEHVENKVTIIEQEHGKKLTALFDGYTQNTQKLTQIQDEVSKHEEVILKRVK